MGGYKRLGPEKRYQIEILKRKGVSNAEIARDLNVHRSTVCREVKRCLTFYVAEKAQAGASKRARQRSDANRKIRGELKTFIDQSLMNLQLSPEQIQFELTQKRLRLSIQTIYSYIERDKREGGRLKSHLRILRKQRRDRKSPKYKSYQGHLHDRVPIARRPKVVDTRVRKGDYERDTLLGKCGGAALLTIVDRKTRYVHLKCLRKKSAELVHRATVRALKDQVVKTITNDNGIEFAYHKRTSKLLGAKIYFSRAYAAWERGTNENINGLLRQYFPKQKAIPLLNNAQLKRIEMKINTRPRKCLGFKTPYELYRGHLPAKLLR